MPTRLSFRCDDNILKQEYKKEHVCALKKIFFKHLKNPPSNLEMNQNKVPGKVSSFLMYFVIFSP